MTFSNFYWIKFQTERFVTNIQLKKKKKLKIREENEISMRAHRFQYSP